MSGKPKKRRENSSITSLGKSASLKPRNILIVAGVAAALGVLVIVKTFAATGVTGNVTTSAGGTTANVWVAPGGSNCTYHSSEVSYSLGEACGSLQAAWSAAAAGSVIRVIAGTYPGTQTLSGNKTAETFVIGAGPGSTVLNNLTISGDNATIQDLSIDTGQTHNIGWSSSASNVTLDNVPLYGAFSRVVITTGSGIAWKNSEFGSSGDTPGPRYFCPLNGAPPDNEPTLVTYGASFVTFDHITFWPFDHDDSNATCDHLEALRLDSDHGVVHDITVSNSFFKPGSRAGSGHVFITDTSVAVPYNLTFKNNVFSGLASGSYAMQENVASGSVCNNWVFAYNFIAQEVMRGNCDAASWKWYGNLGVKPGVACLGTYTNNVWQSNFDHRCTTSDKWVKGTDFSTDQLGFDSTSGVLSASSPGKNAAESGGYCTSPTGLAGLDMRGGARPVEGVCDAGPYEVGAVVGGGGGGGSTPGDVNGDKKVGIVDLSLVLSNFGKTSADWTEPRCDTNGDGKVTILDLSVVLSNYGTTYP
jgi:hypothetical protein